MSNLKLEKFNPSITYKGQKEFDCNNEMINRFVKKNLKKRVKRHLSQAYVLLDENERFVGFYTLDSFAIAKNDFELEENKPSLGLPPIVPVVKLSMIGIDKSLQGKGLGKRLLRDVFLKVYQISQLAGCIGLYLLAEKEAIPFYENLGFIKIKDDKPLPMFLKIDIILKLFS